MKMSKSKESPNHPRISTFGIGTYCNHYFLKMLAFVGRGFYDKAMTAGDKRLLACSIDRFCGVVVPHTCDSLMLCVRDVKGKHTRVHLLSAFLRAKDPIDKRERSEFPQQQTYQCYVRVVVLGVLRRAVFWA